MHKKLDEKPEKLSLYKQVRRELPDSYYVPRETLLDRREVDMYLTKHYELLSQMIRENANDMLHLGLRPGDEADAMQEAVLGLLRQFDAQKISFTCPGLMIGYLLRCGWRNIRDESRKKTVLVQSSIEGDLGHMTQRLVTLDAVAELSGSGRASRGSLDMRDDYQTDMWTGLWENLAEAIVAGTLQFRDVAIYKHYILHKHYIVRPGKDGPGFTIDQMVGEKEFTRKQITNALRVMNTYVADYVATMQLPQDLDYEKEAEDIFGY